MADKQTIDVVIVGSGPAGYTAAIYAARAGRKPLVIEGLAPGGQLMITTEIENFPGFKDPLAGPELMAAMRAQAQRVGAEIVVDAVEEVDLSSRPFKVKMSSRAVAADSVIIATGAEAGWRSSAPPTPMRGAPPRWRPESRWAGCRPRRGPWSTRRTTPC